MLEWCALLYCAQHSGSTVACSNRCSECNAVDIITEKIGRGKEARGGDQELDVLVRSACLVDRGSSICGWAGRWAVLLCRTNADMILLC